MLAELIQGWIAKRADRKGELEALGAIVRRAYCASCTWVVVAKVAEDGKPVWECERCGKRWLRKV
jgi:hypothetical protein